MPFSFDRSFTSYSRVQTLIGRVIRDHKLQYSLLRVGTRKYLNVGCGQNINRDFINIDYAWRPGIDICCNIAAGIHLPDGAVAGIFTEHCLEHVSFLECVKVVSNFYRLLVPGGILRVIVPDGSLYLDLYARAKRGEEVDYPYVGKEGLRDLEEDSRFGFTPMMAVNRIFRGYGHLFAYDYETLSNVVKSPGFIEVSREEFRRGRNPDLLIDSELRRPQSLYLECRKPK